jgi:hypothetical protein
MSGPVRLPEHLHVADGRAGTVYVLNARSGQWLVLNSAAARLWQTVAVTGDIERGIDELAGEYAPPAAERFRVDAHNIVGDMLANRLLVPGSSSVSCWEAPKGQPSGTLHANSKPTMSMAVLAGWSLMIALVLVRLPFRYTLRLVDALTKLWCTDLVSRSDALSTVAAVEAAADRYPGRAACLERSLGAVVAAAFRRRRLSWVLGVVEDPNRFHAWVEVDGKIVTRSADVPTAFIRVLIV